MLPDQLSVKPCVIITVLPHPGCEYKIREVEAGMEEEGIPCLVVQSNEADAVALAYQGACYSKLGVGLGIGLNGLCIHYGKLPEQQPLFALTGAGTPVEWRHFGYNAARLVKGIPFKLQASENPGPQLAENNALYSLVYTIVAKVLQETVEGHGEVNSWPRMR
jgi:hypothetical protein